MIDNEIKKAFAEKVNLIGSMTSVCLDEAEGYALYDAMDNALDLINRLEAEAEKNYNAAKIQQSVSMERFFEIKRLKEENERLKRLLAEEETKYNECAKRFYKVGVKEFAERVKRHIDVGHLRPPTEICFSEIAVVRMIDNLVKEMVGDAE